MKKTADQQQDLLKQWKSTTDGFVKNILKKKISTDQQREEVSTFLRDTEQSVSSSLSHVGTEKFKLIHFMDEMSTYLYSKIHGTIFENPEDKMKDDTLSKRVEQLAWITPQHLDIPASQINYELWEAAKLELMNVNSFVTPKEKLICILNCCKILIYLLQDAGTHASADDFLPHLIYVSLKTNLGHLHSNVKFISSFTDPDQMNDEAYCFFTHLQSAVAFIEMLDASFLSISEEEYSRFMGTTSPSSSVDLSDLSSHKKKSKKALQLLGVDPSTSKVMKKFGIDEQTASVLIMSSSPPSFVAKSRSNSMAITSTIEEPSQIQKASSLSSVATESKDEILSNTESRNSLTKSHSETELSAVWQQAANPKERKPTRKYSSATSAEKLSIEARFPFLTKQYNDLKMSDIPELLASYKELSQLVITNEYKINYRASSLISLKVREKGDQFYKTVALSSLSISALHKCLRKRFKKSKDTQVQQILLLPDTLIERNDDLLALHEDSRLEVVFSYGSVGKVSPDPLVDDETLPELPREVEDD